MNKFCKVFAVVLAVLMLGTMATACKKSDDGDGLGMAGSSFTGATPPTNPVTFWTPKVT